MKQILLCLFLICALASCKSDLSSKDREYIDTKVQLHNALTYGRYISDSMTGNFSSLDTSVLSKPKLTTEEFLNFCKTHDLDPIKTVEKLSDK
jgi:hypothetical protein